MGHAPPRNTPSPTPEITPRARTLTIPISPPGKPGSLLHHQNEGSLLDADHPANGVPFARRSTLLAANLGDDADTTAAITGQLAGALYGSSSIRPSWLEKLAWREEIEGLARNLAFPTTAPPSRH
ncbi:ADP-ribosylglycohydrolase family protein [Sphingobium sp. TKS]|uniref:ADP-ribosylglycohydrolase family protein n=1 Tax=Sphingobium sp. TKS TaxID=1315974 RepID=UPI0007700F79|nr:ADP-ribosylglycohydrolase family protein [Sphingobium sp. TKS]AMK21857.1 ADP-ribosylation/Crystallin J1 [Sphingobium sp. TKS]